MKKKKLPLPPKKEARFRDTNNALGESALLPRLLRPGVRGSSLAARPGPHSVCSLHFSQIKSTAFTAATRQHELSTAIVTNVPLVPATLLSKGPPYAIALACKRRAPTKKAATQASTVRGSSALASTRASWMRTRGAYLFRVRFFSRRESFAG